MSRKSSASSDSLDLLLDTICNTFGGVLFIAMLVIILLNISAIRIRNRLREKYKALEG